jgi:DNA-directed RNA polymerase specialized sigma24 family protein
MATPPTPSSGRTPAESFLDNLEYIEKVIRQCSRAFSPQDAEDFGGHIKLKLVENDYAVIRKFGNVNGATIETFLTTTIVHALYDYRDHLWGKYHPSAKAKELGPVAVRLETLIVRDGYSFEEACEILRTNEGVDMSVAELADLRAQLPYRTPKQFLGEDTLVFEPAKDPRPDQVALEKEREAFRRRVYMGLKRALDTLPNEDHVLVKMWVKFSIAEIARFRKVDQKPLYRRMEKILKALREALRSQGVRRENIKELLGPLEDDLKESPRRNHG